MSSSRMCYRVEDGHLVVEWPNGPEIPEARFDEARAWVIAASERAFGERLPDSAIDIGTKRIFVYRISRIAVATVPNAFAGAVSMLPDVLGLETNLHEKPIRRRASDIDIGEINSLWDG